MSRFSTPYGCYEIDSLPSQVGVAICHGFEVFPEYRGKGHGKMLKAHQMEMLKSLGYRFAQCTVISSNARQKSVLRGFGWEHMSRFYSTRQGKEVEIWGCKISSDKEVAIGPREAVANA